jgi:uncharacterized protein (TIGR04551 family)
VLSTSCFSSRGRGAVLGLPGLAALVAVLVAAASHPAAAQMAPGGMGGGMGGMGPTSPSGEEKKEGVAEAAPKAPGLLPTTPALPAPKGHRKRWKLFELDGYFRARTDWFKNFNLGFNDDPALGGAPFPRSLSCSATTLGHPCDDTLSSGNLRLRLEPTINLDEGTAVHAQIDVLDNLVLGSTPTGQGYTSTDTNRPPVGAFGDTQAPPQAGVNGSANSIVVKRAWAEVAVPLGTIKVGRMPNHWGLGIMANGGGADPINGGYNYDADYGDSVDRLSFTTLIPGTKLRGMIATDWTVTRLTSAQTTANVGHEGHPFDLDNSANAGQWVGVISKMDTPTEFHDAVDRGELALNYGVYFAYKTQSWDLDLTNFTLGGKFSGDRYVPRSLKTYQPNVWIKAGYQDLLFEAEATFQFGSVDRLDDLGITGSAKIRKFGGVARGTWKGFENKLRIGVETGVASGDQWDNTPQGNTNVAFANQLGGTGDNTLTRFQFNRDYHVDLIMWRHLMGAVNNAAYIKPFLSYDLTKSIMFKVANISSFAMNSVSTPGNGQMYGTEFDADLGYTAGNVYAGISYGVLFPFAAMSHPADDLTTGGAGFGYGTDANGVANTGDGGTAHAILTRLVLGF